MQWDSMRLFGERWVVLHTLRPARTSLPSPPKHAWICADQSVLKAIYCCGWVSHGCPLRRRCQWTLPSEQTKQPTRTPSITGGFEEDSIEILQLIWSRATTHAFMKKISSMLKAPPWTSSDTDWPTLIQLYKTLHALLLILYTASYKYYKLTPTENCLHF